MADAKKTEAAGSGATGWMVEVTQDGKEIARIPIARDKMFIGRMNQSHVVLDSAAVSRSHAMLTHTMGKFFIVDQGSQNGTLLNGRVVLQDEWKPGDIIAIGPFLLKLIRGEAKPGKPAAGVLDPGEMTLSEHGMKPPAGKKK